MNRTTRACENITLPASLRYAVGNNNNDNKILETNIKETKQKIPAQMKFISKAKRVDFSFKPLSCLSNVIWDPGNVLSCSSIDSWVSASFRENYGSK